MWIVVFELSYYQIQEIQDPYPYSLWQLKFMHGVLTTEDDVLGSWVFYSPMTLVFQI